MISSNVFTKSETTFYFIKTKIKHICLCIHPTNVFCTFAFVHLSRPPTKLYIKDCNKKKNPLWQKKTHQIEVLLNKCMNNNCAINNYKKIQALPLQASLLLFTVGLH